MSVGQEGPRGSVLQVPLIEQLKGAIWAVVLHRGEDGGQQILAGRLFVPDDNYGRCYAASRSVAVRISAVLLILRLEYFKYYR